MIPGTGKGSADYRHHTTMGLADYRRAGSCEGYPPERVVMLRKCQAFRKHEAPGRGAGHQEGIGGSKKPPENSRNEFSGGSFYYKIELEGNCKIIESIGV